MNPLATQYVQQFVGQRSGYDQEVSDGIFRTAQERQRQFLDRAIKELDSGGVYLILRSLTFSSILPLFWPGCPILSFAFTSSIFTFRPSLNQFPGGFLILL